MYLINMTGQEILKKFNRDKKSLDNYRDSVYDTYSYSINKSLKDNKIWSKLLKVVINHTTYNLLIVIHKKDKNYYYSEYSIYTTVYENGRKLVLAFGEDGCNPMLITPHCIKRFNERYLRGRYTDYDFLVNRFIKSLRKFPVVIMDDEDFAKGQGIGGNGTVFGEITDGITKLKTFITNDMVREDQKLVEFICKAKRSCLY